MRPNLRPARIVRKEDGRSPEGVMPGGLGPRRFTAMGISSYIEAGFGAAELRDRLDALQAEKALASLVGLDHDLDYMADLNHDVAASNAMYVGMAVTEIASLRGQLHGVNQG